MLNQLRFHNSIEMLTARVRAMEWLRDSNEKNLCDRDMSVEERRSRMVCIHNLDQRLAWASGQNIDDS